MLRLIFVTDATAAGRLWSIRQNHPESGSDVLNVYHCQQRVYEEIYVKEQSPWRGTSAAFHLHQPPFQLEPGAAPLWIRFAGQGAES